MSEDIFSYDSSKTAILSGLGFIKGIEVQLLDFGYRHLHNLFYLCSHLVFQMAFLFLKS